MKDHKGLFVGIHGSPGVKGVPRSQLKVWVFPRKVIDLCLSRESAEINTEYSVRR